MSRPRSMAAPRPSADGANPQFRLTRLQTYNWGTFNGLVDLAIPKVGYLFVGPSGSGKSTLLDAHAALLTPPRWVDFNVAARESERRGHDRNVMTYVRGAWSQQTGDAGDYVAQYLRLGTTWSAIAETYENERGDVVVLAQVFWVRGASTTAADVRKLYIVAQRELDLKELQFFAECDFDVRRFKSTLADVFVRDEFSPYQERFRGLLGIDNELALRLLHKTQSAKNLGDINVFLRDFMLDPPETFKVADRLVDEFGELDAAHQAVVAARLQIETLSPARAAHEVLERKRREKSLLDELTVGVDPYREQRRRQLLEARIEELAVEADGMAAEAARLADRAARERAKLDQLRLERQGVGGGLLEQLRAQLANAESERPKRVQKRDRALAACRTLGWELPDDAPAFVQRVAEAKARLLTSREATAELERQKDALKEQKRRKEGEFAEARSEIAAMERQRSNIPARMLGVRATMAAALGVAEEVLPFAGELLQVKPDAAAWRGAVERVLNGLAQSLLVDDRYYPAVASYLNDNDIGARLVYLRTLPHAEPRRTPGPSSLIRKLDFAPEPHAEWLRAELCARFDYACADTLAAFRDAPRALTREGQVKHSGVRHEKDDRQRVDDRSRWVLGFDNREKRELYEARAAELGSELATLSARLDALDAEGERQRSELLECQTLANSTWEEIDVVALLGHIQSLHESIARETRARPELGQLDAEIAAQARVMQVAVDAHNDVELRRRSALDTKVKLQRALAGLAQERLGITLTSTQVSGLDGRFARSARPLTLETLDALTTEVVRGLGAEIEALKLEMAELRTRMERSFSEFNRQWPAESGGLDPVLASAPDYFGKLARLETDGLPRYEERFLRLLREQSDQNLTLLSSRLDQERSAIKTRLELVNESLLTAPFNPGTHLVIDALDKAIDDVRRFKQSLREALSHSLGAPNAELAERRFVVLRDLVRRLSSQDALDKSWKQLVLDVRQHVEFVARELDAEEREVEVYRSGAGKSGGQRQKLAATCLAAALRYQLGGQERGLPCFATVVLDEAFDKADAEFTTMAMNIFKTFGFQMVVATPLKSVMTLEPFIGGACFVHIKERKYSSILTIEYDEAERRLLLPDGLERGSEAAVA